MEDLVQPETWTTSLIIPISKKGDLKKCSNYRTISLISHTSKIILRIILNRLTPQAEDILDDEQAEETYLELQNNNGKTHGSSTTSIPQFHRFQ